MVKVGVPRLESKMFAGWGFVIVAGLLLALIAIIDGGGLTGPAPASTADGSSGCQLEVTTDQLNLRAGPSQDAELLGTLSRGDVVDGTRIQNNLYRQLEDGSWGVTEFLAPLPGSNCA